MHCIPCIMNRFPSATVFNTHPRSHPLEHTQTHYKHPVNRETTIPNPGEPENGLQRIPDSNLGVVMTDTAMRLRETVTLGS